MKWRSNYLVVLVLLLLVAGVVGTAYTLAHDVKNHRSHSIHRTKPLPIEPSTSKTKTSPGVILTAASALVGVEGAKPKIKSITSRPSGKHVKAFSEDQADNGFGANMAWHNASGFLAVSEDKFTTVGDAVGRVTIWSYAPISDDNDDPLVEPSGSGGGSSGSILLPVVPAGVFGTHMKWNLKGDHLCVTQTLVSDAYVFSIEGGTVVQDSASGNDSKSGTHTLNFPSNTTKFGDAGCAFYHSVEESSFVVVGTQQDTLRAFNMYQLVPDTVVTNRVDYLDQPREEDDGAIGTSIRTVDGSEATRVIVSTNGPYIVMSQIGEDGSVESTKSVNLHTSAYMDNIIMSEEGTRGWFSFHSASKGIPTMFEVRNSNGDFKPSITRYTAPDTVSFMQDAGAPMACSTDGRVLITVNTSNEIVMMSVDSDNNVFAALQESVPSFVGEATGTVTSLAMATLGDTHHVVFVGVSSHNTVYAVDTYITS